MKNRLKYITLIGVKYVGNKNVELHKLKKAKNKIAWKITELLNSKTNINLFLRQILSPT
jgi:hypothetical protein